MTDSVEVYVLTTSWWDPHQMAFAENKENILHWEWNLINRPDRQQILLTDIIEDYAMVASAYVGSVEVKAIDVALRRST